MTPNPSIERTLTSSAMSMRSEAIALLDRKLARARDTLLRDAACLLLCATFGTATAQPSVPAQVDDPARAGVLVLDATPEYRSKGCQKLVAWDHAAMAYFRTRALPQGHCRLEVGQKAIPTLEQIRRSRGMPRGSYGGVDAEADRLRAAIRAKEDEVAWLRAEHERALRESARDPEIKQAYDGLSHLSKFGITGASCSANFSRLEACPRHFPHPPVPRDECLVYLRQAGYEDPCPALGKRQ